MRGFELSERLGLQRVIIRASWVFSGPMQPTPQVCRKRDRLRYIGK